MPENIWFTSLYEVQTVWRLLINATYDVLSSFGLCTIKLNIWINRYYIFRYQNRLNLSFEKIQGQTSLIRLNGCVMSNTNITYMIIYVICSNVVSRIPNNCVSYILVLLNIYYYFIYITVHKCVYIILLSIKPKQLQKVNEC